MASEPILCFDGDKAGRKAAYRAIDIALPLIGPGKSLRFALLPEGQDPDDLARSGGAPAIARGARGARSRWPKCCFCARPRASVFDTPEQRAALERRLRELAGAIARRDAAPPLSAWTWSARLAISSALGAPPQTARPERRERFARSGRKLAFADAGPRVGIAGLRCPPRPGVLPAGPREAPREIVILAILINHPELLERQVEEIAGARTRQPALAGFRDRLLSLPGEAFASAESLADALAAAGLGRSANASLASPPHGRLVVPARRGGSLGRRTGFASNSGLASQARDAK